MNLHHTKFLVISSHIRTGPPRRAKNSLVASQKKNLSPSCQLVGRNVLNHVCCVNISIIFNLSHYVYVNGIFVC
jgi:hypothetical protein